MVGSFPPDQHFVSVKDLRKEFQKDSSSSSLKSTTFPKPEKKCSRSLSSCGSVQDTCSSTNSTASDAAQKRCPSPWTGVLREETATLDTSWSLSRQSYPRNGSEPTHVEVISSSGCSWISNPKRQIGQTVSSEGFEGKLVNALEPSDDSIDENVSKSLNYASVNLRKVELKQRTEKILGPEPKSKRDSESERFTIPSCSSFGNQTKAFCDTLLERRPSASACDGAAEGGKIVSRKWHQDPLSSKNKSSASVSTNLCHSAGAQERKVVRKQASYGTLDWKLDICSMGLHDKANSPAATRSITSAKNHAQYHKEEQAATLFVRRQRAESLESGRLLKYEVEMSVKGKRSKLYDPVSATNKAIAEVRSMCLTTNSTRPPTKEYKDQESSPSTPTKKASVRNLVEAFSCSQDAPIRLSSTTELVDKPGTKPNLSKQTVSSTKARKSDTANPKNELVAHRMHEGKRSGRSEVESTPLQTSEKRRLTKKEELEQIRSLGLARGFLISQMNGAQTQMNTRSDFSKKERSFSGPVSQLQRSFPFSTASKNISAQSRAGFVTRDHEPVPDKGAVHCTGRIQTSSPVNPSRQISVSAAITQLDRVDSARSLSSMGRNWPSSFSPFNNSIQTTAQSCHAGGELPPALSMDSDYTNDMQHVVGDEGTENRYIQISLSSGGVAEKFMPNIVVSPTEDSSHTSCPDDFCDTNKRVSMASPVASSPERLDGPRRSLEPFKGAKRFLFGKKSSRKSTPL